MTSTITKTEAEYKIVRRIKASDIEDILSSALGGAGINYWVDDYYSVNPRGGDVTGISYIEQALTHGYFINIRDSETGKWHRLTLKKLLKGFALMDSFNYDEWDGPMADSLVQMALFGEIVYG